jgi:hypothetical protein
MLLSQRTLMQPTGRTIMLPVARYRDLMLPTFQESISTMRGAAPKSVSATPQSMKPTAR